MRHGWLVGPILGLAALTPALASAATYTVFTAGGGSVLGTFEAPDGGGALVAASFSFGGGVFDLLGTGSETTVFDPATGFLTGAGGFGFGGVFNSVAFDTVDVNANPVSCAVGGCAFLWTDGIGGAPGEFSVASLDGLGAALDFGFYSAVLDEDPDPGPGPGPGPSPIPLPASALLLGLGLAGLGVGAARRRA